MVLIGYPEILFNDLSVNSCVNDLFHAPLDQGVVVNRYRKRKCFAFPISVFVIIQVLGILIPGQRVAAPACIKIIGGVFWGIQIVF